MEARSLELLAPGSALAAKYALMGYVWARSWLHVSVFRAWAQLDGVATLPMHDKLCYECVGTRDFVRHWNLPMRAWLLAYVRDPLLAASRGGGDGGRGRGFLAPLAGAATFAVSALWHAPSA